MKQFVYIFWSVVLLALASCNQRLDANLYNQQKLSEYRWDAYEGEVDFVLDDSYKIAPNRFLQFPLVSKATGDQPETVIQAIYLGDIQRIALDTVILYCHGNKDHMDFYWQRAKLLAHVGAKHRYGVMMFDYRGFGLSEGEPTEEGLYSDVQAALDWLKERGLNNQRLIVYGFSLGSAPATLVAAYTEGLRPSKLILEAPFASSQQMVRDASLLEMPATLFTDAKINNAEVIRSVQVPFCWIHGDKDDFLDVETHGRQVFNNYGGPYAEAHVIAGAGHSSVPQTMGFEQYLSTVHAFIRH
jgi:pimeloyl-ACP methyl ester carboxylesterase